MIDALDCSLGINISSIEAPDADNYGDPIADPYVTSDKVDLPVAAINGYTKDNGDSTNCEPVLGREYVATLLAQVPKPRGTDCMFPMRISQSFMDWPLSSNASDNRDGGR
ncbi:hypothetical protein DL764_002635 [Monosporascus ibericus]|uniref:Uncharacterized protein n=1 Tax=Monosporascus ibericus TaxID=155417 RepID=A0A4Q4TKV6_9PEZI|nr:hypothetical protein DL764_002635 [Monosporascus ibericus]